MKKKKTGRFRFCSSHQVFRCVLSPEVECVWKKKTTTTTKQNCQWALTGPVLCPNVNKLTKIKGSLAKMNVTFVHTHRIMLT